MEHRQEQLPALLYLTYHENVLRAGILHTQVVKMLEQVAGLGKLRRIVLLSYLSPQTFWRERKRISPFKKKMAKCGITVILLPMLIPAKWKLPFPLLMYLWVIPTWIVTLLTGCRIIHSRGYPAAMIAQTVSKFLSLHTVFDPRGPYPAEMVMNSIWRLGSSTERFWKKVEARLIATADVVIGVTPEYRDEFRSRDVKQAIFIPNRTDTKAFREAAEASIRERNSIFCRPPVVGSNEQKTDLELLFIGELHSVWNDPRVVGRHFVALNRRFPDARLRLITTANPEKAQAMLSHAGVDSPRVTFESRRPEEMPKAMQGATFGLIFCAVNVHSLWSVKIAEYLAAGIPLIVDKSMIGLPLKIIQSKRLGVVVDPENPDDYNKVDLVLQNWPEWSERCIRYSQRRLDLNSTARQHLRLYRSLS